MIVASLHYAAPEQFEGAVLDGRADVYSLGCTLFHLLTGEPPYPGDSLPQLMHAHLGGRIPAPSWIVSELPVEVDRVVGQAMAKNREDRYPTAVAFAEAAVAALEASGRRRQGTKRLEPADLDGFERDAVPEPVRGWAPADVQKPVVVPVAQPVVDDGETTRASLDRPRKWMAVAAVVLVALVVTVLGTNRLISEDSRASSASVVPATTMLGADGVEYTVSGTILEKYSAASASQKADLGQPLGTEKINPDGKYQWFVGGVIIQKTGHPPYIVWGEIRNKWNELGGSQGTLGYPVSDEIDVQDVKVSTFERGSIYFEDGIASVR